MGGLFSTEPLMNEEPGSGNKATIFQVVRSVLSAAIGVQSDSRREQDFKGKSITPYVIGGIVFTVLFVVVIIFVVNSTLSSASG